MGYAIELYFDPAAARALLDLRHSLSASLGIPPADPADHPHISLAVTSHLDDRALEPRLRDFAASLSPFPVTFAAVSSFPSQQGVLFLTPAASAPLLQAHARLHDLLATLDIRPHAYYAPGQWTPHCTVAQDFPDPDTLTRAFASCRASFRPLRATADSVGLVRFRPVQPLLRYPLCPSPGHP